VIMEVAILNVKPSSAENFEAAFREASKIISSAAGYVSHELHKCVETANRYVLLVRWETVEDHTVGFRQSDEYKRWRKLLHYFYEPFPTVEHYTPVLKNPE
jgi:heme-degrading monooxygenase HmoA